jgi:ubiquinone/menaquinone biosynthesis C-methylase UbiE
VAVALAHLMDLGDCVDMGSGDGALIDLLLPGCRTLTCIDLHPRMVQHGQQRVQARKDQTLCFLEGDMQEPPLAPQSADTVLFLQSLQYAEDPKQALASAFEILRPGGRVLVQTLQKHQDDRLLAEYGHVHRGFTKSSLRSWIERAGFESVLAEKAGHDHRMQHLALLVASGKKPAKKKRS